ncbi:MAG: methylenetetrahydrofolate reductase [NAD(P)H] [Leptospirales bacterium]
MDKITNLLQQSAGKRHVFSFEFFPPKNEEGEGRLYQTIDELRSLSPDFVSVTYGAGGSTREKTLEWVNRIRNDNKITAMAHFTCVGASRQEILKHLQEFSKKGIRNIMALRGDPPKGETKFTPPEDGFAYASELIEFIHNSGLDFSIGAAAYPEVHLEARNAMDDMKNLKKKVESGAQFLITQLFFDNNIYFQFVDECRKNGINIPIIPGIMPITSFNQVDKFTEMTGTKIPESFLARLAKLEDDPEGLCKEGIDFATQQSEELLEKGVPGLHFYTLNRSPATKEILKNIKGL